MKNVLCIKIFFLLCCSAFAADEYMAIDFPKQLRVNQGTLVEIEKIDGSSIEGKWGSLYADKVSIRVRQTERFVGVTQIAKVYRLEPKSRKRGAIRGVKMGALAGAATSLLFIIAYRNEDVSPLVPIFYFMPMGVGLGAVIGAHITGYNKISIFERKDTVSGPNQFPRQISGAVIIRF